MIKKTLLILTVVLLAIPINSLGLSLEKTQNQNFFSNTLDDDTNTETYEKLLSWTEAWCEGLDEDKEIVDAIFDGFVESEVLKYGKNPDERTTEEILDNPYPDGSYYAMCDGISQVFQDACAVQGIEIYKFWFLQKTGDNNIKGIACLSPGLGRSWDEKEFVETETGPWCFIDEKTSYDYPSDFTDYNEDEPYIYYDDQNPISNLNDDVNYIKKGDLEAYCFRPPDGHSINLYKDENGVHLYDLSFGIKIDNVFNELPLEPNGDLNVQGYFTNNDWSTFREKYHDQAVNYYIREISYTNDLSSGKKTGCNDFLVKTKLYDDTWPSPYRITLIPSKLPPICKIKIHCFKDENENGIQDNGEKNANGMYVRMYTGSVESYPFGLFYLIPFSPLKRTDYQGDVEFIITPLISDLLISTSDASYLLSDNIIWMKDYELKIDDLERGKRKFDIGLKRAHEDVKICGNIRNVVNEEVGLKAKVTCKGVDNDFNMTRDTYSWSNHEHGFYFYHIPFGTYEITIEKEGYETWKETTTLDGSIGNWYRGYNILLKPEGSSKNTYGNFFFLFEKIMQIFHILDALST